MFANFRSQDVDGFWEGRLSPLIFDKDHTLVSPKSGDIFVENPTDQRPKVEPLWIKALSKKHDLFIASNQGGIAAGYKSMDEAIAEMRFCLGLFPEIKYAFFAPNFEGDVCVRVGRRSVCEIHGHGFRKPNGGMIRLIAQGQNCCFVGDRPEDEGAAIDAGCQFMNIDNFIEGGYHENFDY